jgi:hypothetical protein
MTIIGGQIMTLAGRKGGLSLLRGLPNGRSLVRVKGEEHIWQYVGYHLSILIKEKKRKKIKPIIFLEWHGAVTSVK